MSSPYYNKYRHHHHHHVSFTVLSPVEFCFTHDQQALTSLTDSQPSAGGGGGGGCPLIKTVSASTQASSLTFRGFLLILNQFLKQKTSCTYISVSWTFLSLRLDQPVPLRMFSQQPYCSNYLLFIFYEMIVSIVLRSDMCGLVRVCSRQKLTEACLLLCVEAGK